MQLKLPETCIAFRFIYACYALRFPSMELERFQIAKVTLAVNEGH